MKLLNRLPLALLFLGGPILAADLDTLLAQLASDDYKDRQTARTELFAAAAVATGDQADLTELEDKFSVALLSGSTGLEAKRYLVKVLAWAGTPRSAATLYQISQTPGVDAVLRERSIQALSSLPGEDVTGMLMEGLEEAHPSDQTVWWQALASQAGQETVPLVIARIDAGGIDLSGDAIAALGQMGGTAAARYLFEQWMNADEESRLPLEMAYLQTGSAEVDPLVKLVANASTPVLRLAAYGQLLSLDKSNALAILDTKLMANPPGDDSDFIRLVLETGSEAGWDLLLEQQDSLDEREMAVLINAIGEQAKSGLEPVVREMAKSDNETLQRVALRALTSIGSKESTSLLIEIMASGDDEIQALASDALARIEDPDLDQRIIQRVKDSADPARADMIDLLTIRNSKGAVGILNQLLREEFNSPSTPDILSALEKIGDVESCRQMASFITNTSDRRILRKYQLSLKRLAIRLAIPDYLWEEVFEPAIQAADTDSYRANLVSILDCLSNETALEHVAELREAPGSRVLQQAATRAMSRWSHMDIGEYWLEVANNPQSTAADLKDATAGLIRVVQSDSVKGKEWEKAEFGMEALRSLKEDDVKRELLEVYRRKDSLRKELLDSLEPYLQLAEEIESLMAEDG